MKDSIKKILKEGDLKALKKYHEEGGDLNKLISFGEYGRLSPLQFAVIGDQKDIILYLLKNGAEVNAWSGDLATALHYACQYASPEVVRLLVAHGADMTLGDGEGRGTPVFEALTNKEHGFEIIKWLLENGDKGTGLDRFGRSLVHAAVCSTVDILDLLMTTLKPDINTTDEDGWTPLHILAVNNGRDMEMAKALLKYGASVSQKTNNGVTPIEKAKEYGYHELASLLENAGQ